MENIVSLCTDSVQVPQELVQVHQDLKGLHPEFDGNVEDNTRGQLKANSLSQHQVWHILRANWYGHQAPCQE